LIIILHGASCPPISHLLLKKLARKIAKRSKSKISDVCFRLTTPLVRYYRLPYSMSELNNIESGMTSKRSQISIAIIGNCFASIMVSAAYFSWIAIIDACSWATLDKSSMPNLENSFCGTGDRSAWSDARSPCLMTSGFSPWMLGYRSVAFKCEMSVC
jgi:hypothetical protein